MAHLPYARAAAYTAAVSHVVARRGCTRGTRESILQSIRHWAHDDRVETAPIFWITGLAGLGKTTIAYSACELLEKDKKNLAVVSFFCSRQLDTHEEKLLVSTLVLRLAESLASFAEEVVAALGVEHHLGDQKLGVQLDKLLIEPWQKSMSRRKHLPCVVVIVDALDENDAGVKFARRILAAMNHGQLPGLRMLFTSHPSASFERLPGFRSQGLVQRLDLNTERSVLDNDILRYLNEELPEHRNADYLQELATVCAGLFIYASTAILLVRPDPDYDAKTHDEEKDQILQLTEAARTKGHNSILDKLYEEIVSKAFGPPLTGKQKDIRLHVLLTFIIASRIAPLRAHLLHQLAGVDEKVIGPTIAALRAVLYTNGDGTILSYHASFEDFMLRQHEPTMKRTWMRIIQTCWGTLIPNTEKVYHHPSKRRPWELTEENVVFHDVSYTLTLACIHRSQALVRWDPNGRRVPSALEQARRYYFEDPSFQNEGTA